VATSDQRPGSRSTLTTIQVGALRIEQGRISVLSSNSSFRISFGSSTRHRRRGRNHARAPRLSKSRFGRPASSPVEQLPGSGMARRQEGWPLSRPPGSPDSHGTRDYFLISSIDCFDYWSRPSLNRAGHGCFNPSPLTTLLTHTGHKVTPSPTPRSRCASRLRRSRPAPVYGRTRRRSAAPTVIAWRAGWRSICRRCRTDVRPSRQQSSSRPFPDDDELVPAHDT
jgi:hypothetical protein